MQNFCIGYKDVFRPDILWLYSIIFLIRILTGALTFRLLNAMKTTSTDNQPYKILDRRHGRAIYDDHTNTPNWYQANF